MTNSINKAIIVGHLGVDPQLHQSSKTEYTRFSIADTTTKDGQEHVQWHQICAFGKQAQLCCEHLHKGDLCCVEGRVDCHAYEKDGVKRYAQSIIAERITFLSTKRRSDSPVNQTSDRDLNEVFSG